jgi:hypothetical protein
MMLVLSSTVLCNLPHGTPVRSAEHLGLPVGWNLGHRLIGTAATPHRDVLIPESENGRDVPSAVAADTAASWSAPGMNLGISPIGAPISDRVDPHICRRREDCRPTRDCTDRFPNLTD